MIYFSSDWHLGHKNIIKFCNRPFENTDIMDKTILDNYRKTVKDDDEFYYLGDFSWLQSGESVAIWNSLPGKKFFIAGNHDDGIIGRMRSYVILDIFVNKVPVTLCHYPMLSWNKSHFGAIQLHGHHHTLNVNTVFPGKRINVACDMWNFMPVSADEVLRAASKLPNNWDYIEKR